MTTINSIPSFSSVSKTSFKQAPAEAAPTKTETAQDAIELSTKEKPQAPAISTARLLFGRLTDEQIKQVNESKQLPENAKFVMNGFGGYSITNNFFNFRAGTRQLPEGFEVKKDIFGFTVVLPKGMTGISIKDAE